MTMVEEVRVRLEAMTSEMIKLVQDLVSFPSTFGHEEHAQMYFAQQLRDMNGITEIWEPDIAVMRSHPAFVSGREDFSGSPVVCARFPGQGGGRSLLLCGHMDVVPPGAGSWGHDPWSGVYEDGRIYGRGSADMKGGLACGIIAMKAIQAAGVALRGDVMIASTVDEECGSTGALALVIKGLKADACIIPEPTGLEMNIASTGSIWFKIRVRGQSAHAGMAYKGINSIQKAMLVIHGLKDLEETRRIRLMHPLYAHLPVPFCLNINTIRAGDWPAIVPAETIMEGRMGVSPEETIEEAKCELETAIMRIASGDPWLKDHVPEIEYLQCRWNSGLVSPDHPFSQVMATRVEEMTGEPVIFSGMGPCSDSGTLIRFAGIPSINFGPRSMSMAHQTDEHVDLDSLMKTAQVIAATILDWCGVAD